MAPFVSTEQAIFLAPFVSTFIHDAFSALWATLYNGVRGNLKNVYKAAFKTKSGKFVMLAAVIGGPIGMTDYVLAINYMGASIGAVASAVFPAIGAILAACLLSVIASGQPGWELGAGGLAANGFGGVDKARWARALDQIGLTFQFKDKARAGDAFVDSFLPASAERVF